jgi:hypothetical protein
MVVESGVLHFFSEDVAFGEQHILVRVVLYRNPFLVQIMKIDTEYFGFVLIK